MVKVVDFILMKHEKLNNAPIAEAIIGIEFQPYLDITESLILLIKESLKSTFSKFEYVFSDIFTIDYSLVKSGIEDRKMKLRGAIFKSEDNNLILQILEDSISFHQTKPYKDFEYLSSKFFYFIDLIKEDVDLKPITRLGLRYINQFLFKEGKIIQNLNILEDDKNLDYSGGQNTYYYEIDEEIKVILRLGIDNRAKKQLIDIDCIYEEQSSFDFDRDKVSNILAHQRKIKNNIFFEVYSKHKEL